MKRILCSLLVATLPFGSVLADAPKSKNAKVTLVYQHELPNVPGKSIKGVLVEYGPGGYSPGHTHPKSAFIYATVLEGAIRSLSGSPLRATGIVLRPAASSHLSQLAHQFFRFCDVSLQRTAGDLCGEVGHVDDHRGASHASAKPPPVTVLTRSPVTPPTRCGRAREAW